MVTGSHIPADRNGIKFNKCSGEILKQDEARMMAQEVLYRSDVAVAYRPRMIQQFLSTWPAIRSYFLRIVWRISK